MSILRDFEKRLEGAVEGFFARAFRSGLQPVELAKAIQRYQADHQHVGVKGIYVPNVYRFSLSDQDLERFSGFTRSLQRELSDVARRTADDRGWHTQGPIRIEFERSQRARVGTFELRGKSESPDVPQNAHTSGPTSPPPERAQDVLNSTPTSAGITATREPSPQRVGRPMLRAVGGTDKGSVFELEADYAVIGRQTDCEVTLTGAGVSRRHARIQREGERWTITDLGSTNGIKVNSQQVQISELRPGDRVEIGDAIFTFVLAGN